MLTSFCDNWGAWAWSWIKWGGWITKIYGACFSVCVIFAALSLADNYIYA